MSMVAVQRHIEGFSRAQFTTVQLHLQASEKYVYSHEPELRRDDARLPWKLDTKKLTGRQHHNQVSQFAAVRLPESK
jgi:hypothetical protein